MKIDIENIEKLVSIMNDGDLSLIEITNGESKIKLRKNQANSPKTVTNISTIEPGISDQSLSKDTNSASQKSDDAFNFSNSNKILSPLIGVFFSSPSPDAEPFVKIGSKVKKGDIICIIETMKVLNEITSEYDGEVVDICINNGDIAEFGQTLFQIMSCEKR